MILVGRLQVDEGTMGHLHPIDRKGSFGHPAQCFLVIVVAALVTDDIVPLLIFKIVPNPSHPARMHGDWGVRDFAEDSAPDLFPAFGFGPAIIAVPTKNPHDGISAPASDHIAGE